MSSSPSTPPLIFTIRSIEKSKYGNAAVFTIEIIDEFTLRELETKYPQAKMIFDWGRIYAMQITVEMPGLQERSPDFWAALCKTAPEIVRQHIVQRLKGAF